MHRREILRSLPALALLPKPSAPSWPAQIPLPKFRVGQWVRINWICEDVDNFEDYGRRFYDQGQIVGLNYYHSFDQFRSGWYYWVEWHTLASEPRQPLVGFEPEKESDLTLITA